MEMVIYALAGILLRYAHSSADFLNFWKRNFLYIPESGPLYADVSKSKRVKEMKIFMLRNCFWMNVGVTAVNLNSNINIHTYKQIQHSKFRNTNLNFYWQKYFMLLYSSGKCTLLSQIFILYLHKVNNFKLNRDLWINVCNFSNWIVFTFVKMQQNAFVITWFVSLNSANQFLGLFDNRQYNNWVCVN